MVSDKRLPATQYAIRSPPIYAWLAASIMLFAALLAWNTQYYVDYEVTLLPWLTRRGWVLYRDMVDQHPPLFPALLAMLDAGDPGLPARLIIVGLGLLTLLLTYRVATRLAGPAAGAGAVTLAALWAALFEGNHLWYDGALGPVYLGVLGVLAGSAGRGETNLRNSARTPSLDFIRSEWVCLAVGLLMGAGMLFKQQAILGAPFVALAVWGGARAGGRRVLAFMGGLAPPLILAGVIYAAQDTLGAAWYWVVAYSLTGNYATAAALAAPATEIPTLAAFYTPALALVLVGIGAIIARPFPFRLRIADWGMLKEPDPTVKIGAFRMALAGLGLLIAATAPAWPRYGRFHFQAAVPLLAVAGGVALAGLSAQVRRADGLGRLVAGLGLGLLSVSTLYALGQEIQGLSLNARLGPVVAPYSARDAGVVPLRAWVDAHAPPQAPIVVYHLDNLLYRLLDREPPRPWAPQYPWILAAGDADARWWAAVAQAQPLVAVVSAGGWDTSPVAGPATGEGRLRYAYHEVQRFQLRIYPFVAPVGVVGLLRNDGSLR